MVEVGVTGNSERWNWSVARSQNMKKTRRLAVECQG